MRLRNNSNHEWLNYQYESQTVDIKAKSEFIVDDKMGYFLLKRLGHPNWLVKVDEDKKESTQENGEKLKKNDEPWCKYCGSKGRRHKKGCTKPIN